MCGYFFTAVGALRRSSTHAFSRLTETVRRETALSLSVYFERRNTFPFNLANRFT